MRNLFFSIFILFTAFLKCNAENKNIDNSQKRPILTTSGIVHYCPSNKFVIIERLHYPPGLAIFGGHVEYDEPPQFAFKREVQEELNISDIKEIQLFSIYGNPGRDPRGHRVDIVYSCITNQMPKAGSDAKKVYLFTKKELQKALFNKKFAFDHKEIIEDYLKVIGNCDPCKHKCNVTVEKSVFTTK